MKTKTWKRLLAAFLTLAMVFTMAVTGFATEGAETPTTTGGTTETAVKKIGTNVTNGSEVSFKKH